MSDKPVNSLPPTIKLSQLPLSTEVSTQGLKTLIPVQNNVTNILFGPSRLVNTPKEKGLVNEPSLAPSLLLVRATPIQVI